MSNRTTRRRLLQLTSASFATALAGCGFGSSGSQSSGSTPTDDSTPTDTTQRQSETDTPTETTTESAWDFEIQNFVNRDGTDLVVDGDQYRFNGMMALLTHTELGQEWTNQTMAVANQYNIQAYRCWGFPAPWDDTPSPHQAPKEFNDEWFEAFDYTVAKAKEAGVRLIVPLLQGVHTDASNNRTNYAPSPATYGTWSETTDYTDDTRAFIEDEQANAYFKEYIEYFLTRENQYTGVEYRNEPTILLWECANELEYRSPEDDGHSIASWYKNIASYIKSIDGNHLVSTGMHGSMGEVYQPWTERCAFVEDHQVDEIDVCSFHDYPIYPFSDGVLIREKNLAARYVEHKIDLAHNEIEKPVYGGEYGGLFDPDVETAYVSRLETEESAEGIQRSTEYPNAYRSQHDDAVLVVRKEDIQGVDLTDRNEYFRNITDVAAEHGLNGLCFWALSPDTAGASATDEERRKHREKHNRLIVYPSDSETLNAVQAYYSAVVE